MNRGWGNLRKQLCTHKNFAELLRMLACKVLCSAYLGTKDHSTSRPERRSARSLSCVSSTFLCIGLFAASSDLSPCLSTGRALQSIRGVSKVLKSKLMQAPRCSATYRSGVLSDCHQISVHQAFRCVAGCNLQG